VRLEEARLSARGTQIGAEPEPYRLDYQLKTGDPWVTESLYVEARSDDWERRLVLARDRDGGWTANGEPRADLGGAVDCDLGLCPLTNTMPVLREGLLERGAEPHDFVMAWVAVPGLTVHRSDQRYEPVNPGTVRYVGKHRDFVGDLTFDADGLVVRYPGLAERVEDASLEDR
jgi:uncharacterized protein